jgi:hypothetical protein
MADIHCKYCHKSWKYIKDYEKHLACCEYFYQFRRKPQTEMDDYGTKMPTYKELFRFVQELSLKCERLEREVTRLKTTVSVRQKKVIVECLNQANNIPSYTFCDWWKDITLQLPVSLNTKEDSEMRSHWSTITNPFLYRVFNMGLLEGVKYLLGKFIESERQKRRLLPIRCFTQKPNMFYIYCGYSDGDDDDVERKKPELFQSSKDSQHSWTSMSNADLELMVDYMSQLFVREFLLWQRQNTSEIEQDERRGEEQITYMMRVNSMRPSKEKGIAELRKWLFATLEENAQNIAEVEWTN